MKFTQEATDPDVLNCPECDGEGTHHTATTVHTRRGEDGPTLAITIEKSGAISSSYEDTSPSRRRDAVVMHYECENGCLFDLVFSQHKGETQIYAVPTGEVDRLNEA